VQERKAAATAPDKPPVLREHIFRTTMQVALCRGFGHVTLDAVARESGLSKGGLLYHFATKRDLIAAMLRHYGQEGPLAEPACGIDPLAVAALIAAAEDPSLLAAIAPHRPFRPARGCRAISRGRATWVGHSPCREASVGPAH
jgi:AcrR family transcriptional regulator